MSRTIVEQILRLAEKFGAATEIGEPASTRRADIMLCRGELTVAVTIYSGDGTKAARKIQASASHLGAVTQCWIVAPSEKRLEVVRRTARSLLGEAAMQAMDFLTVDELEFAFSCICPAEPQESFVRGYCVRTSWKAVRPSQARQILQDLRRILERRVERQRAP